MSVVNITIKERISSVPAGVVLVCNNPTDTILFEFDEEWDAYELKTARFSWGNKFIDVPFPDKAVRVPEITNTQYVFVGVYANGIASTPIKLDCKRSILCLGEHEYVPPEHTYWDEFGETLEALNKAAEDTNAAAQRAEKATEAANTATENANNAAEDASGNAALASVAAETANEAAASIIDKAPAIVCSAEDEMIALTDSSDEPLRGLRIFGKTTQDGTPTPDAPVPLVSVGESGSVGVSVCGKNLLDFGTKTFVGTTEIECDIPPGTYTFSATITSDDTDGNLSNVGINSQSNRMENLYMTRGSRVYKSFTVGETITKIYFYAGEGASTSAGDTVTFTDVQLEYGNTMTAFEPYKPVRTLIALTPNGLPGIPVSSSGNYTDTDGQQWVCDEVDFERGVYVQRVGRKVFDGTEAWQKERVGWYESTYFVNDINGAINGWNPHYTYVVSNTYIGTTYIELKSAASAGFTAITSGGASIEFTSDLTTVEEWKAYLSERYTAGNPVIAYFIKGTPIETPLTAEEIAAYRALHTNKPNTTIYNDEGAEMEVQYVADTKLYIDNKFTELRNALISTGGNV